MNPALTNAGSTIGHVPASGSLDGWLSASPCGETPAVRDGRLRSMVETPLPRGIAFLWVQVVAASGLALTRHPAFAAWIAIDAALMLVRVLLNGRLAEAIAGNPGSSPAPVSLLMGVVALQYCAIAAGIIGLMRVPDLQAMTFAVLLAIAFSGLIGSRFAAVPRFAALLICLVTAALSIGFFLSPYPDVYILGIMLPASAAAFSLLAWQNHKVLVDALKAQEANRRLSLHDGLTGLPNRLQLRQRLAQACHDYRPGDPRSGFTVLCMDLDGFKPVNDRLGHAAGDHVLQQIARRLPERACPGALVSRIGGDEFVALLPTTDPKQIAATAARMIDACRAPIDIDGMPVTIGLSIGISIAAGPCRLTVDDDGERLLREADEALYAAKRDQRGTWRFHGAGNR